MSRTFQVRMEILVSDRRPDFIKTHIKQWVETNSDLRVIFGDYYLYSVDFDSLDNLVELDHPLNVPSWELKTGFLQWLLCLYNSEEDIVLWNPLTGTYHKLPVSNVELSWRVCDLPVYLNTLLGITRC